MEHAYRTFSEIAFSDYDNNGTLVLGKYYSNWNPLVIVFELKGDEGKKMFVLLQSIGCL